MLLLYHKIPLDNEHIYDKMHEASTPNYSGKQV